MHTRMSGRHALFAANSLIASSLAATAATVLAAATLGAAAATVLAVHRRAEQLHREQWPHLRELR